VKRLEMKAKLRRRFPHGVTLLTPWVLGSTLSKFVSFGSTEASLILDHMEAFPLETRSWMKKLRLLSKLEMKKLLRKLSKKLNADGGEDDDCSKNCFALHGEIFSLSI
jgi:hypothetical protein